MTSLQDADHPGSKTGSKGTSPHFSGEMAKEEDIAPLPSALRSAALLRATIKVSVNSNDRDEISFIRVQVSVKYSIAKVRPESKAILNSCTRPHTNKHS